MRFRQVTGKHVSLYGPLFAAAFFFVLCLSSGLLRAANLSETDIRTGAYRPVYLPNKSLSNSQLRERLNFYRLGDTKKLANLLLSRSYGDALDYYYLAHISNMSGWDPATRIYARLAAISLATQIGRSTEDLYRMREFQEGCGRIPIERCPATSLARSIIELNAVLDATDALKERAVAVDVPESFPASGVIEDSQGRNIVHWYPGGRRVWVSMQGSSDVRFMSLDGNLGGPQVAVPRFDRTDLVRAKTHDAQWSVEVTDFEEVARIFSYQGATAIALERLEKLRSESKFVAQSKYSPDTLRLYDENQRSLSQLRALIDSWRPTIAADMDSRAKLLESLDGDTVRVSRDKALTLQKVGDVERTLQDILQLESHLSRSGENVRLLQLNCVGVAYSCEEIRRTLDIKVGSEVDRPYTLFVAPGKERKSQSVIGEDIVRSSYVIGTQQVRNPEYQNLQADYQNALLAVEAARAAYDRARYAGSVNPGFASGFAIGQAMQMLSQKQRRVAEVSGALARTPSLVDEERLSPYEYLENRVKTLYVREYGLILAHRATGRSSAATVVVSEEAAFTIAQGRSDTDKLSRAYSKESAIMAWLDRPRFISRAVIDNTQWRATSIAGNGGRRDFAAEARELVASDDGLLQSPASVSARGRLDNGFDPRIQSVVLVKTGSSVGAGFFVSKRNILTNAHVVGAEMTAEIKYSDGRKTIGRIIAVDERRDLALLRVDVEGQPSAFVADKAQIRPGVAVDVIGHPEGLEFSFSRGVVSAIRRDFKPAGGVDVIQIDSAINPGNSGGPLFIGNSVIGIVTFKKGLSEGLGFAVHRDEIQEFLRDAFTQ
jgi:S1-C subfamily serine protease